MKIPQDIIIFALPKHDDAFTSTPWQLAVALSDHFRVWYISHPYTIIDYWRTRKMPKASKRLESTIGEKLVIEKTDHPNLAVVYAPVTLPINGLPPGGLYQHFSTWNQKWVARKLNKWLAKTGIDEAIFINSHDFYFPNLSRILNIRCLNIYHCIDPIVKAYSARHGITLEKQAASKADLVVSTSPFLQQKMEAYNPKSYLVPNAANYALSSKTVQVGVKPLEHIAKIEGNKIGYIGNIERRINYALLEEVFHGNPDWNLVMIGPADKDFIPDSFLKLPNLHMLNAIAHEDLPRAMKALDVLIIPFVKDQVSAQIYPLKLFEYLGSGKPVVATDFNTEITNDLEDVLKVCARAEDFEKALFAHLNEQSQIENMKKRMAVAKANDWSSRAEQFMEIIKEAYGTQREN